MELGIMKRNDKGREFKERANIGRLRPNTEACWAIIDGREKPIHQSIGNADKLQKYGGKKYTYKNNKLLRLFLEK